MGTFRDSLTIKNKLLEELEFKYDKKEKEWVKSIRLDDTEVLYIKIDCLCIKVELCDVLDGKFDFWKGFFYVPDGIMDNKEEFIDWLDSEIEIYKEIHHCDIE